MPNLSETITKLRSFADLEEGWRFGEGGPPNPALIRSAEKFLKYGSTLGIERFNAFSGSEKEVLISFYTGEQAIEFVFYPDGQITLAEDRNGEQVEFKEGVSEREIYTHIWTFRFTKETLFAPSIRETSTTKAERSTAQHFDLLAMAAASQSSTPNVQSQHLEASATTSPDSIPALLGRLVSTGPSEEPICPTPA